MVAEVDHAVLVQVGDVVFVVSVPVVNDSLAVRKIEHAQGLADNLVQYVAVAAVEAGAVHASDGRNVRCGHLPAVAPSVQREQLVLLPGHIDIDVEFHVLLRDRHDPDAQLETGVRHRTDVGQELVEGERRYGHIILVEHIGRLGIVALCRKQHPVAEQAEVSTEVEGAAYLPPQVRIAVAQRSHRYGRRTVVGNQTGWDKLFHGQIGTDGPEVAGTAVARSQVKQTDRLTAAQEPFPLHVPSHRNGREDSPGMALAHHRRTVGTGRQIERIAVEKRIGNSTHEGGKSRVCIAAACSSVRTVGCCSEVVVAEAVAGKSFHLCPESSHLLFLVFSKQGGREVVYAPVPFPVEGDIPQHFFRLPLSPICHALRPHPCRSKFRILRRGVGVRA